MSALDLGRYSVAAGCVGICDGCVEASVAYATERRQFGVPIARFQLVQAMIAEMIVKRDAARLLVLRAGGAEGRGRAEHDRDLDREALRHRVGGRVRERRDPGPRRRRLRRRPPGRALPARRPRDHALRGDVPDPEADHRPRRDRDRRDPPVRARGGLSRCRASVVTRLDGAVGICRIDSPETRNALSPELLAGDRHRARGARRRPAVALHAADRRRRGLRDRRRPALARRRRARSRPGSGGALGPARRDRVPDRRRRLRLGARQRLRAGARLRPDRRLEDARVRPARGHARADSRRRRHPAADPDRRQAARDGARPHRSPDRRRGRRASTGSSTSSPRSSTGCQTATELAAEIATRAPIAARLAKRAILAAEREGLDEGLETERRLFAEAMATEDRVEGVSAFLEGRRPRFEGARRIRPGRSALPPRGRSRRGSAAGRPG